MAKQKTTKRALLSSVLALVLCVSMLVGTTFAWFTDSVTSGRNVIQSGNLDMKVSFKPYGAENTTWTELDSDTAIFDDQALFEPGYTEAVWLKVENDGSLAFRYDMDLRVYAEIAGVNQAGDTFELSDHLTVLTGMYTNDYAGVESFYDTRDALDSFAWKESSLSDGTVTLAKNSTLFSASDAVNGDWSETYVLVVLTMPEKVGNEANHNGTNIPQIYLGLSAVATQTVYEKDSFGPTYDKDATYPDLTETWDGGVDTSWYDDADDTFIIYTAEELAGFAKLVDEGNTFEGKTVILAADIDLASMLFEPIGSYGKNAAFKGTFDGQGHTISNLSQNTWELNNGYYYGDLGLGLFGKVEDAKIKNLTMDGAEISGESAIVGIVAATAYGECTFENIKVTNSNGADYQYYAGGIVGWASGDHRYINCDVDETTTIGSQWGDFGNASGGIIGGAGASATIYMKDCDVACRIDAVNDVVSAYQWGAYRNCGMLIGRTNHTTTDEAVTNAAAPNLTCENVTVTYGEWANYTYCEFAGTGYPYVRVQAGTSVDAYSNVRYGHPTDANGNTVVDDNHVHNEGEDHHLLIAFDQLYGGPGEHRYCTYGTATHDGVTVIYNKSKKLLAVLSLAG